MDLVCLADVLWKNRLRIEEGSSSGDEMSDGDQAARLPLTLSMRTCETPVTKSFEARVADGAVKPVAMAMSTCQPSTAVNSHPDCGSRS